MRAVRYCSRVTVKSAARYRRTPDSGWELGRHVHRCSGIYPNVPIYITLYFLSMTAGGYP